MVELRSEEEQLDAVKRWWKENGMSLIAGAVLAAAGVFGWNAWQNYQQGQSEAASMRYQQLVNMTAGNELEDDQLASAREMVVELTDEHGDTLYAELALLLDARLAVQQGDLEGARTALESAAESSRRYVQSLAWLRLARVELADGNPTQAHALLDEPISDALAAQRRTCGAMPLLLKATLTRPVMPGRPRWKCHKPKTSRFTACSSSLTISALRRRHNDYKHCN